MIKYLCLIAALAACGDNAQVSGSEFWGTWEYARGEAQYFCSDGQAGWLTVTVGSRAEITREDYDDLRITYGGECPGGFVFKQGDEEEEGWISQNGKCEYESVNAFGTHQVSVTNTSDSSLRLNEDYDQLIDRSEYVYVFTYAHTVQRCQLFSVGFANRVGTD